MRSRRWDHNVGTTAMLSRTKFFRALATFSVLDDNPIQYVKSRKYLNYTRINNSCPRAYPQPALYPNVSEIFCKFSILSALSKHLLAPT